MPKRDVIEAVQKFNIQVNNLTQVRNNYLLILSFIQGKWMMVQGMNKHLGLHLVHASLTFHLLIGLLFISCALAVLTVSRVLY